MNRIEIVQPENNQPENNQLENSRAENSRAEIVQLKTTQAETSGLKIKPCLEVKSSGKAPGEKQYWEVERYKRLVEQSSLTMRQINVVSQNPMMEEKDRARAEKVMSRAVSRTKRRLNRMEQQIREGYDAVTEASSRGEKFAGAAASVEDHHTRLPKRGRKIWTDPFERLTHHSGYGAKTPETYLPFRGNGETDVYMSLVEKVADKILLVLFFVTCYRIENRIAETHLLLEDGGRQTNFLAETAARCASNLSGNLLAGCAGGDLTFWEWLSGEIAAHGSLWIFMGYVGIVSGIFIFNAPRLRFFSLPQKEKNSRRVKMVSVWTCAALVGYALAQELVDMTMNR